MRLMSNFGRKIFLNIIQYYSNVYQITYEKWFFTLKWGIVKNTFNLGISSKFIICMKWIYLCIKYNIKQNEETKSCSKCNSF